MSQTTWEYLVESISSTDSNMVAERRSGSVTWHPNTYGPSHADMQQKHLNELGEKGWELISTGTMYIYKRPKQ